jgi:tetratricopeptide (TPR) repeat protein
LEDARRGREAESFAAGEQFLSTGEYDAAMEQYRKILSLDPANARARRALEAARKGKETENSIR